MIRDYKKLVDEMYDGEGSDKIITEKIRETIKEDSLEDAVENVLKIMIAIKREW